MPGSWRLWKGRRTSTVEIVQCTAFDVHRFTQITADYRRLLVSNRRNLGLVDINQDGHYTTI